MQSINACHIQGRHRFLTHVVWPAVVLSACMAAGTRPFPAAASWPHIVAAGRPILAVAIHGNVYLLQSTGVLRLVSPGGSAQLPQLSPDGSRVAYLTASGARRDALGHSLADSLWVAATGGRPRRVDRGAIDAWPSWSPDSRHIAYYRSGSVVVRGPNGGSPRTAIPGYGSGTGFLAWSPDSGRLAAVSQINSVAGQEQDVVSIARVSTHTLRRVTVTFGPAVRGRAGGMIGSIPTPQLAFSPDGAHLITGTILTGAGYNLDGIWRVSDRGGRASLFIGTRRELVGGRSPTPALDSATRFLLSPNRRWIATDPGTHLWLGDARTGRGRVLPLGIVGSCALTQLAWLRDSSGLAYVTVCNVPGPTYGTRLSVMPIGARRPLAVKALGTVAPGAIEIAPAYRCIACG